MALLQIADDRHIMVWTHHHLLLDGWSQPLLMQELFSCYHTFDGGQLIEFPERPPFKNYIEWLQQQNMTSAESFWAKEMSGFTAPTPLPGSRILKDSSKTSDYTTAQQLLSPDLTANLREFSRQSGLTLNTLLQGAWALLLSRYSNEQDIVFGSVVSGRPPELSGADQMIGLFINTLPVRIYINDEAAISEWLQAIQKKQVESRRFEYSSLVNIKSWSRLTAIRSLFDTLFVFESYPVDDSIKKSEHSIHIGEQNHFSRTNYPLTFICSPGKQIGLQIAYETDRFQTERIQVMMSQVELILEKIIASPQAKLKHLALITAAEFEQIIFEWNKTSAPLPDSSTIPHLFEQVVKKFPQQPALFFEGKSLTFHELDKASNQLARFLIAKGVKNEDLIAVCMDRSLDMVTALLAILKSGCACVPIDPYYPQERIRLLLEESRAALLLTQSSLKADLASSFTLLMAIDEQKEAIESFSEESVDIPIEPENLAYIIFTSGSTGRPKGTLVPHKGVCNFKDFGGEPFAGDPKSRILQFSSFSFDASMGEIFKALLNGGTLYLAPRSVLISVDELSDFLNKHRINYVTLAPSLLSQLDPQKLASLSTVISVGEACSWELVKRWSSGRSFLNGYGPTETTIGATIGILQENIYETSSPSIGRPSQNIQVYILDPFLNPVPVGLTGQIFIGGVGVTRGYLKRPDLTADRFIPNPFHGNGERMYKTGDLGKFTPDGQLVFEGRADFQVKLRGFRIELGEIEAQLEEIESINKAVVIVREDIAGDKRLAAYVAPHGGQEINVPQIVATLKEKMPDYMVPAAFVVLETFPLTPNGKVDRKALPAPDQSGFILTEYVAPRTPTEELIAAIFQDVLHVDRVSINDDFFNLGGHSLLATQLVSRLREAFSVDLSLQHVFATPTVADLGLKLNELKAQGFGLDLPSITPQTREGDLPLSFAQQRLWFLDQLQPESPFYNIPIALKLEGDLNIPALEKSFNALIQRHESLRTAFGSDDGRPFQRIASNFVASIEEYDLSQLKLDDQTAQTNDLVEQEAVGPFNLAEGPLFRIVLIKLSSNRHVLLFTLHHIIGDGWSVNLLVRDVVQFYHAFTASQPINLPELPIQYADFSIWQRQVLQGEYLETQLSYWRQKLVGVPSLLELPTDFPRPRMQSFNGATLSRTLSSEISNAVKAFSRREGVTPFMTLFAVFASVLYRYSRQNDFNIGTPIANRNRMETEGLIGFFVNNLVLRCRFDQDPTFLEFLQSVRSNALDAYAHQDIPFEMLVEQLHPQRDLSHSPLFQVVFVLQNTPMSGLELPGLQVTPVDNESFIAKFDLSLEAAETANGLFFQLEYNTDLFRNETANRLLHHLELFLRNALLEPEQRISEIEFIPEGEERLLLRDWNQSDVPFDSSLCAHQVFERYAVESPDKVAVTHGDAQLTYSEL
ncbi:MAG: amino acid adenylation domain-containing protein, partial [Calditrichaeota bacterium]